jgi:hypothetical protein
MADGGQTDDQSDQQRDTDALADAFAGASAEIQQAGETVELRGEALGEQCADVAQWLREGEDVPDEHVDAIVTEALEAVGDVEAWSSAVFEVLSAAEALRAVEE